MAQRIISILMKPECQIIKQPAKVSKQQIWNLRMFSHIHGLVLFSWTEVCSILLYSPLKAACLFHVMWRNIWKATRSLITSGHDGLAVFFWSYAAKALRCGYTVRDPSSGETAMGIHKQGMGPGFTLAWNYLIWLVVIDFTVHKSEIWWCMN